MKSNKRKTGGAYRRKKQMIRLHATKGKDRKRQNSRQPVGNIDRLPTVPARPLLKKEFEIYAKMRGLGVKDNT